MSDVDLGAPTPIPAPGQGPQTFPEFTAGTKLKIPEHIAIVMDGNGRWANARGLPRTEGHKKGEDALMDVIAGAAEAGVKYLTVYAFSTENWRRSPAEVRFLMGYSRQVIRRRVQTLNQWNVKMLWSGRTPRLWKSVIKELQDAEQITRHNTGLTLTMCINYGSRAEITDGVRKIAERAARGEIKPGAITEKTISASLYLPQVPDVDLLIRSGGEQRISNYLLWQCAYAEFVFVPTPWPEFNRETLWQILKDYTGRDRRFGTAIDAVQKS